MIGEHGLTRAREILAKYERLTTSQTKAARRHYVDHHELVALLQLGRVAVAQLTPRPPPTLEEQLKMAAYVAKKASEL